MDCRPRGEADGVFMGQGIGGTRTTFTNMDNHGLLFSHPLLVSSHIFKQNNCYMNQIRVCENDMRESSSNTARAAIPT
jgi:hypothetical protein